MGDAIELTHRPLAEFATHHKFGYLLCNPPYGERLGDTQQAEDLYRQMDPVVNGLRDWSVFVLTPHQGFEGLFGRAATHRRKLYNGRIPCVYYQFFGPRPPGR
jgi:putative N6-adenine-specific DNA methylase